MAFTVRKSAAILRRHGYKLTPQRKAVLEVIAFSNEHLTPAEIYEEVCRIKPETGLVTIYRTLDILGELGLLCEVHAENRHSFIMSRRDEHHHHLICSSCGAVVDFSTCDLEKLQHSLARRTGYKILDHLLEFTGLCRNCQKESAGNDRGFEG